MRNSDLKRLSELLHQSMDSGDDSCAKAVAADLNKPYFTLMAEINALFSDESRNKLGLVTAIRLLQFTGCPDPFFDFMGQLFNCLWVPRPAAPPAEPGDSASLHRLMSSAAAELGDVAAKLNAITAPDSPAGELPTPAEFAELSQEVTEALGALIVLEQAARAATVLQLGERRQKGSAAGDE